MKKPTIIAASALSALVLAGGVGAGLAFADPTPSTTPSTSASPTNAKGAHQRHGLFARALHGEVTVDAKKPHVVDFQRGTVSAVSATSITVASKDGFSATYVVAPTTTVRKDKAAAVIADVKTGDRVRVIALKAGSTVTAKRIGDAGTK